jgi:hypothetical protein
MDLNVVGGVWVVCAVFSMVIASSKGRSEVGWLILGGLFGVFALFAVGVMPKLEPQQQTAVESGSAAEQQSSKISIVEKILLSLFVLACIAIAVDQWFYKFL